jgi:hypothetical protein
MKDRYSIHTMPDMQCIGYVWAESISAAHRMMARIMHIGYRIAVGFPK